MVTFPSEIEDMDVKLDGPGANTSFSYGYRDASNHKQSTTVVLEGRMTEAQVAAIKSTFSDGEFFIPGQVGLKDLQGSFSDGPKWTEDDHVWHTVDEVRLTDEPATSSMDVGDMLSRWPNSVDGWDEEGHASELEDAAGSEQARP